MQKYRPKKVLVIGCFDPFHIGHLLHFQAAREYGDVLVVAVTKNNFVNKGKNRPMFDEKDRAAVIRALACVDDVILVESSIEALCDIRPNVFCIGKEYENKVKAEDSIYCRKNGISIVFTNERTYSSTKIINDLLQHS